MWRTSNSGNQNLRSVEQLPKIIVSSELCPVIASGHIKLKNHFKPLVSRNFEGTEKHVQMHNPSAAIFELAKKSDCIVGHIQSAVTRKASTLAFFFTVTLT